MNTQRVEITRTERGDLLIHPVPVDRGAALLDALAAFDYEFASLLEEDRHAGKRAVVIYRLDTNTLIYLVKNKPPIVAQCVNALDTDAMLGMSFVTYAELLKGAERSTRKPDVLRQLDQLICVVPALLCAVEPPAQRRHADRRQ